MFVDPATAGVSAGHIFVHHAAPSDSDGPMRRFADFWEVTAVTAKRVWAARTLTETVEEIPDPDGVFYGGRLIRPIAGRHDERTLSLMRVSVESQGKPVLHLPRRHCAWISMADTWDKSPQFVHPN